MADVDVIHTVTEVKKTRKVKKSTTSSSKRRESSDQGSEVQITEIEQTANETDKGYVLLQIMVEPVQLTKSTNLKKATYMCMNE